MNSSPPEHPSVDCAQSQGYIDGSTHYEGRPYMSDLREDINDPRIYDETDDILVKLSALISVHTKKPKIIGAESDLLHRWISTKANEYRIDKYTKEIADIKIDDEKVISYKTNARQLTAANRISDSSSFLMSHLDFLSQLSNLDHALGKAYDDLMHSIGEGEGALSAPPRPDWQEFRQRLHRNLGLLMQTANATYQSLEKAGGPRGQPPKTLRDRIFTEWHEMLVVSLNLSNDKALHLACDSWPLYFPREYIGIDAAKQVLKSRMESSKGI